MNTVEIDGLWYAESVVTKADGESSKDTRIWAWGETKDCAIDRLHINSEL